MRALPVLVVLIVLIALGSAPARAQATTAPIAVRHVAPPASDDIRARYPLAVLRLALERSGVPFRMQASPLKLEQERALALLRQGRELDVVWTAPTLERTHALHMVPHAIDRGLLGWRVLLIRQGDAARFAGVTAADRLVPMLGVQGHDWPDLQVLRANGLQVVSASSYTGMFSMVRRRHVDYFPRSVAEVQGELASRHGEGLVVEPRLLLHYPFALYFFVSRDNRLLAAALERGMRRCQQDGSLAALFERTYGDIPAALGLQQRLHVELRNPDLPFPLPASERAALSALPWRQAPGAVP